MCPRGLPRYMGICKRQPRKAERQEHVNLSEVSRGHRSISGVALDASNDLLLFRLPARTATNSMHEPENIVRQFVSSTRYPSKCDNSSKRYPITYARVQHISSNGIASRQLQASRVQRLLNPRDLTMLPRRREAHSEYPTC